MLDEEWTAKVNVCGQSERLWNALRANFDDEVGVRVIDLIAGGTSRLFAVSRSL